MSCYQTDAVILRQLLFSFSSCSRASIFFRQSRNGLFKQVLDLLIDRAVLPFASTSILAFRLARVRMRTGTLGSFV